MNKSILLKLNLEPLKCDNYQRDLGILCLQRTASLISNKYLTTSELTIYIFTCCIKDDGSYSSESLSDFYLSLLDQYFISLLTKIPAFSIEYLDKASYDLPIEEIFIPRVNYENRKVKLGNRTISIKTTDRIRWELKTSYSDLSPATNLEHKEYIVHSVDPIYIWLRKVKAYKSDLEFFNYIDFGNYALGQNLSFLSSEDMFPNLSINEYYGFDKQDYFSGSNFFTSPHRSQASISTIRNWPTIKTSSDIAFISLEIMTGLLGTIGVNDYGPNHTTHGLRTNLPALNDENLQLKKRIAVLGGSFAYGAFLPTVETLAFKTESRLNQDFKENSFAVYDLSCPGDTLLDQFIKLIQVFHLIKPDIVISIGGLNDILSIYHPHELDYTQTQSVHNLIKSDYDQSTCKSPYKSPTPIEVIDRVDVIFKAISGFCQAKSIGFLSYLQPWPDLDKYFSRIGIPMPFEFTLKSKQNGMKVGYDLLMQYYGSVHTPHVSTSLNQISIQSLEQFHPQKLWIDRCHITPFASSLYSKSIVSDLLKHSLV